MASNDELIRLTSQIPSPHDYFQGLCRREEAAPDNIVIFVRKEAEELDGLSFHHRWLLVVAMEGAGTLLLDGRVRRLRAGQALLVPPLQLHSYRKLATRFHWVFVSFDWPSHSGGTTGRDFGSKTLDAEAFRRLDAVVKHWMPPVADGGVTAAHLLELVRRLYPSVAASPTSNQNLIDRVQAAAQRDPAGGLRAVAQGLHMSESHLRARFRQETGMSLGRYLREVRLRQAAIWIRDEGMSVTAAADRAGYPDVFTFSRTFRRVLGSSPSEVRKK